MIFEAVVISKVSFHFSGAHMALGSLIRKVSRCYRLYNYSPIILAQCSRIIMSTYLNKINSSV